MNLHNLTLSILLCLSTATIAEMKMDSLKIGSKEFKSVSLSLEPGDRVKIVHEAGVVRIQASELPSDVQLKIGWKSAEEKSTAAKALLDREYPVSGITIANRHFTDSRVTDELNKFLDSNPNGKVLALTIEITENPKQCQFIKIVFDQEAGLLLHLRRTSAKLGNVVDYDLVKWSGINREKLRKGIPWMDDNFKPLGKSERGTSPLNLQWSCDHRPEIAEWP